MIRETFAKFKDKNVKKILREVELGYVGHEGYEYGYLVETVDNDVKLFILDFKEAVEVDVAFFQKKLSEYRAWADETANLLTEYELRKRHLLK